MLLGIRDRGQRGADPHRLVVAEHLQPGGEGGEAGKGAGATRWGTLPGWPGPERGTLIWAWGGGAPAFKGRVEGKGQDGAKLHNSTGVWTAGGQGSMEVLGRLPVWGHLRGDRGVAYPEEVPEDAATEGGGRR